MVLVFAVFVGGVTEGGVCFKPLILSFLLGRGVAFKVPVAPFFCLASPVTPFLGMGGAKDAWPTLVWVSGACLQNYYSLGLIARLHTAE